MARPPGSDELAKAILEEHGRLIRQIREIREALDRGDAGSVRDLALTLCADLRDHIVDEEPHVLKILIEVHGRAGTQMAIRLFHEHGRIRALVAEMERNAGGSPDLLAAKVSAFIPILEEHMKGQEGMIRPSAGGTS